jgi:hypothetical protein
MVLLTCPITTLATSLVYKFFVSEITRRHTANAKNARYSQFSLFCFDMYASKYDSTEENAVGLLATYLYQHNQVYAQIDGAFGHITSRYQCQEFNRTQTDDLLLSLGFSKAFSQKTAVTFSGILGFPTHKDTSPEGLQFGIAHSSIGFKIDAASTFSSKKDQKLLLAGRYLRFLPSNISLKSDAVSYKYELDIGSLFDLLVGYNFNFKLDGFELGYNPSFLVGGKLCPESTNNEYIGYMRSTLYGAYYHILNSEKHRQILTLVCTYGTEHKPKIYKRFITAWATWSIFF